MKRFAIAGLLALSLPLSLNAAPVDTTGKQYDMAGRISVHGTGKCYGRSASAGKVSPVDIFASIKFGDSDQAGGTFDWFNDTLMAPMFTDTGEIVERSGNKMTMIFTGENAQTAGSALFSIANIPPSSGAGNPVSVSAYSLTSVVTKNKLTVTEKVSVGVDVPPYCSFKWTIKRKMKGDVVVPPPLV
jgi:hypothetical protein